MEFKLLTHFAASEYNCGAYGVGAYDEGSCTTSTGSGGTSGGDSSGGGGGLADTGMNMLLFLAIGLVLVVGSVLYLFRSIRKTQQNARG